MTQYGCVRGKGSGGCEWRVEESREEGRELQGNRQEARKETARTPWPGQGAIDLQGSVRSKPSKSGGTTRAEGVRRLAASGRRQRVLSGISSWERTHRTWTAEGRSLDNPMRGSLDGLAGK